MTIKLNRFEQLMICVILSVVGGSFIGFNLGSPDTKPTLDKANHKHLCDLADESPELAKSYLEEIKKTNDLRTESFEQKPKPDLMIRSEWCTAIGGAGIVMLLIGLGLGIPITIAYLQSDE